MPNSPSGSTFVHIAVYTALLAGGMAQAYADTTIDAVAAFRYNDNVNRSERDSLREGDGIFSLGGALGYRRQLGNNHGFIANARIDADLHTNFGDLDRVRAKTSLTYLIQPIRGFNRPWLALTGAFNLLEFAASDIRDGNVTSVRLEAGQRLTDRIATRLGYTVSDRDASKTQVFELHQRVFHAVGEYAVTNRLGIYLKYDLLEGDVVTGAPRAQKLRVSRVRTPDRVFGPANVAWRLGGELHTLRLGSKYSLSKRTVLDVAAHHSTTQADGDNQWREWNLSLSLKHRY